MTDDELLAALARPEACPWRPSDVEAIETHISWILLAGDRVVKVKRPVHFGFVDHSTIERRRHSCEEEVRFNRRLTDEIYLGVVPISLDGTTLTKSRCGWTARERSRGGGQGAVLDGGSIHARSILSDHGS